MLINTLAHHLKSKYRNSILSSKRQGPAQHGAAEEHEEHIPPEEPYRPPAYPYRELVEDDIRLLRILPGTGDIECLLHQMPLAEAKDFYALSYVWGDVTEKKTIMLEGRPFQVTQSLYEALHQFREQPVDDGYPDEYFWVDAVCINQDDIEERSRQVSRMIDIYNAGLVVTWLGPVREWTVDSAYKKLLRRVRLSQPQMSMDESIELLFSKCETIYTQWQPLDDDDNAILDEEFGDAYGAIVKATIEVLSRPWFKRAWTIQEACLDNHPNMYLGRHSVYMYKFLALFEILASEVRFLYISPGAARLFAFDGIHKLYYSVLYDWDDNPKKSEIAEVLARLLRLTSTKVCSDPKDQLYGILGLLRQFNEGELPEELAPDYRLSYEDVYWNYAAFLFQSLGDLELLGCRRREFQRQVPSWVPDFRYFYLPRVLRREPSVRVSPDKKILHLRGCVLGTFRNSIGRCELEDILPTYRIIPTKLLRRTEEFEENILGPSAAIREITIEEAFDDMMKNATRILTVDNGVTFSMVYSDLRKSSGGKRSRSLKKRRTIHVRWKEEGIADQLIMPFLLLDDGTILRVVRENAQVRTGDLVCMFKSAPGPCLVRPSGESYTFVGVCDAKGGPLKEQKFDDDFWANREMQDFDLI
ncbi:HET-domain-containing protein [Hypoxylon sp. FL0543]|nr:HET-domain-containing protein [Hypoxylon sp. FL0543]